MTQISLASAIETLQEAVHAPAAQLSAQQLTHTTALATQLLQQNIARCLESDDPRLIAALSSQVEQLSHLAHRARLQLALRAAATGAHALDLTEYDAVREQRTDYSRPARFASGRPCYKTPESFLSSWLRIDYHEAAGMLADAQLVVGRITMAGTLSSPRFNLLATQWLAPDADPRGTLRAARALNRLEPKDTIAQGIALAPSACHDDGRTMEEHAATLLDTSDPVSGRKHVDDLLSSYREAHTEVNTPEEGLTRIRTVNGVDEYRLRVKGANAGLLRSVFAQADNPKTQAGAAARESKPAATEHPAEATPPTVAAQEPAAHPEVESPPDTTHQPASTELSEVSTPSWLNSTAPAPEWAGINPAAAHADESSDGSLLAATTTAPPATSDQVLSEPDFAGQVDNLVPARLRRLNALMALLEQRSPRPKKKTQDNGSCACGAPAPTKTIEPELLVFIKLDDLQDLATAHGITSHGVRLSPAELRKLLCRSKIIPIVFGGDGRVLDLGRSSRFYPDYLKKGIIARDRGCLVPACKQPPENCDVHHVEDGGWQGGCPTDIRYGGLLCRGHHTAEQAGIIKVVMYRGLPHVLLPKHLDPTQTPRRNTYWLTEAVA